ncbi:MAG TPA: hypothetical protein VIM89_00870 [Mucilaginibacter sp.]
MPAKPKLLSLVFLLIILNSKAFGQATFFKPNAIKDSISISESLITANKIHPILLDSSGSLRGKWVAGKVMYSPDGLLKATQLIGDHNFYTTTIEYIYHQKVFKQDLNYKSDFSNYPLTKIYRLPGKDPAYLFLLSEREALPNYEHDPVTDFLKITAFPNEAEFKHIQKITNVALVLSMNKDSLSEVAFPPTSDDDDDNQLGEPQSTEDTVRKDSSQSLGFISDVKQSRKYPKPFLKYDTLTHTLNFLDIYYKTNVAGEVESVDFLRVHSGSFDYKDSLFVLTKDTFYYHPSLETRKLFARKNYKAGKFIIKTEAFENYHDYGEAGIFPELEIKYKIGNQTLTTINNAEFDEKDKDLKPDYKLQNNSALILLLTDETNGHRSGMCGAATSSDSDFWLINSISKPPQKLFSFSYSTCYSNVTYSFIRNGKKVTGSLYIDTESEEGNKYLENSYWKNNSTYVFLISNPDATFSRNFYLHFNSSNKKIPVTLTAGKLYETKR